MSYDVLFLNAEAAEQKERGHREDSGVLCVLSPVLCDLCVDASE
jgi:hypothetical protein